PASSRPSSPGASGSPRLRATASRCPSTIRGPPARRPIAPSPMRCWRCRCPRRRWRVAERKRGMGRGLAAILPESSAGGPELRELDVSRIEPNPDQPRANFDAAGIDALAGSIGSVGLLQPLIVRPLDDGRYELVAGERRWRAAQKAGIDRVPAVIRSSPEDERLQAALIENMVREDLNPVEEARA